MGHGENTSVMELLVSIQFTFDFIAGSAHAGAIRTATLDDEIGDDTVKGQAIIEALAGQKDKVIDRHQRPANRFQPGLMALALRLCAAPLF